MSKTYRFNKNETTQASNVGVGRVTSYPQKKGKKNSKSKKTNRRGK